MDENLTAFVDKIRTLGDTSTVDLSDGNKALAVPNGTSIVSLKKFLDEYRLAPERKKGQASALDVASFIALAIRGADAASVLFADDSNEAAPYLLAVLNYNQAQADGGAPAFGDHRIRYDFPQSEEWKAWADKDGDVMNQAEFAAFLEDRILDVIEPPKLSDFQDDGEVDSIIDLQRKLGGMFGGPSALLQLSRGMAVSVDLKVAGAANLQTGEARIQFEETHTDGVGAPLIVPSLFLIAIPVFKRGAPYRLACRLRYRVAGGKVVWFYQIYQPDASFLDAFKEAADKAAQETGLALYYGKPEA